MLERGGKVYLDTNAIIEAHRIRCWKALCNHFDLHTVAFCKREALAGNPAKKGYVEIPEESLTDRITVHEVAQRDVVAFSLKIAGEIFDVDGGERELLTHALLDPNAWLLCGPDNASLHALNFFGLLDRVVSLEEMCITGKIKPYLKYKGNYTAKWMRDFRMKIR